MAILMKTYSIHLMFTTMAEYTYVFVFLLIPHFSLLLQFVFFILIVPSLLLFSPTSDLSPPPLISQSFHLISISTTFLPAAMELCILFITEVVQRAADLASDHNYTQVLSALRHTVTQTLLCKHTSPLSYIWEIKNIHDELELYIKSDVWIIYAHNQLHHADMLIYSHTDKKRAHRPMQA